MSLNERELVATSSQVLAHQGHGDLIWGHASTRDAQGRGVWIKQAGCGMEEVVADRVHLVGWDGDVADGTGTPHSEYPIHTEIMRARPEIHGVVHTHSSHAVALAASGTQLLPVSHAANYFVPPELPRFTHTADLILTPELGKQVALELGDAAAMFLVNHGIVTVGRTLQQATVAAVLLEQACLQQLRTHQFGGWPQWSNESEGLSKREHIYSDGALTDVWSYLVRQLASD
ncbi:L-fuculose-phosphate aldolase [Kribbella sp. VKM Ac-2527]|uniref:L-fuculose-phosphate aldolase n=1 Tax=Kribbella caucasensis TaxID=2512215 RepID=A0A4R6KHP1_9ACTN|nr:class II aldolase/adducin family protein [Kribbella sp. VKM Ac-2527]TDO50543.1 L-fuculose-phosphate aldolase [Kribbella sp. VKM Ac-2527]